MIELIYIHPCCEIQGNEDARVDVDFVDAGREQPLGGL